MYACMTTNSVFLNLISIGKIYSTLQLAFVFLTTCTNVASQTADPDANPKTKQLFSYIAGLPKQGTFLSGQFAGYSPDTFNISQFEETAKLTGQTPAILACDWACGWDFNDLPQNIIDFSCNPVLKNHWNKGGLVSVNMHFPNPAWPRGGGFNNKTYLNFDDMLKQETDTGKRWRLFLDRIALGLDDLQNSNTTVIFRPFHEMNGDWFWWGDQDSAKYKLVWQGMFNYLTKIKNLHNLLWVYSPDQSRLGLLKYYPGDAFVDIVGLDAYEDDPYHIHGYEEMIIIKKSFAFAEVGPKKTFGNFDYTRLISAIESKFQKVSYVLAWNDKWAPIANKNAEAYFNDPHIINRGDIKF